LVPVIAIDPFFCERLPFIEIAFHRKYAGRRATSVRSRTQWVAGLMRRGDSRSASAAVVNRLVQ